MLIAMPFLPKESQHGAFLPRSLIFVRVVLTTSLGLLAGPGGSRVFLAVVIRTALGRLWRSYGAWALFRDLFKKVLGSGVFSGPSVEHNRRVFRGRKSRDAIMERLQAVVYEAYDDQGIQTVAVTWSIITCWRVLGFRGRRCVGILLLGRDGEANLVGWICDSVCQYSIEGGRRRYLYKEEQGGGNITSKEL